VPKHRAIEKHDSAQFAALCDALLRQGVKVRFRARGESMQPNILNDDAIVVAPADPTDLRPGEVVLIHCADGFRVHRVLQEAAATGDIVTRGDASQENDPAPDLVLGKVIVIELRGCQAWMPRRLKTVLRVVWTLIYRLKPALALRFRKPGSHLALLGVLVAFGALFGASPVAAQADLSLTQAASPSVVAPGGTITYTLNLTNNGPNTAVTAVVYQQTPPNTTFQSIVTPANWTCKTPAAGATGQIICTFTGGGGNFTNGSTATFTINVTVNSGVAAGTVILNSADTTSTTSDPLASNNASTSSVRIETAGQADLTVSMTAAPTPVFVFSTLTYTIQVQNLGLASATSGSLIDTIPVGATFVSSSSTQGTCSGTSTVTCALGTIVSGSSTTVTITVTAPGTATTLTNTATVNSSTTDPVGGNNSATTLTVVQPLVCATPGRDGPGATLTGVVNAFYPPNTGTLAAGSISVTLGAAAAGGAQTAIAAGDLLLVIQMQDAAINSTNTGAYGDGSPGDPALGSTSLNNSGNFEFVTATSALPTTGGTLNFRGTGPTSGLLNTYTSAAATATQGQRQYQVVRVPQYTSATLSSTLTAMAWNGATGGVLALDVASQLSLGGTVSVNALGFRGGAGRQLAGGAGAATDYVTLSTNAANGSKGEGIAGTQRYVANATLTNLTNTGAEGLPNGSYSRGAPGNAGGGATDAHPAANDQNSGGGGGGNGGAGGQGGFGWSSAGIVGGFGGAAFPSTTSALVLGGGGGAGTTNNGTANPANANPAGINSSGAAGGGIVIIHAGAVTGVGTITANGQTALNVANDGGGGGGAGGSVRVLANSGGLSGLTVNANGGSGGHTWSTQPPGTPFPGNRHGPGGGGGGGAILLSGVPVSSGVAGGQPGTSTTATDAYGATVGAPGVVNTAFAISQTPGTQPGGECSTADLAVTNVGSPNPVLAGSNITYTQTVTNNGPLDAVNAVFSEAIPANTTFQSLTVPGGSGWTCTTPAVNGTGSINCTHPNLANAASTAFSLVVQVNAGTAVGTVITDVIDATSGTNDLNLANNSATVQITVGLGTAADLSVSNVASPNPVIAGNPITYAVVVRNNGAATASNVVFSEAIPANTTFVSSTPSPATGWSCSVAGGILSCSNPTLAASTSTSFTIVVNVVAGTASGTVISDTANVSSTTRDPNPNNNSATANVVVATTGQADLIVTSAASPNPVTTGNNITYTQSVTNNGPAAAVNAQFTDTIPTNTTFVSMVQPAGWICVTPAVGGTGTVTCTALSVGVGAIASFPLVVKVNPGVAPGTVISNTASVSAISGDPSSANNSVTTTVIVASPTQADVAILKTASPEPVNQGTNLSYTLQVTNNGPAVAQGVTASDPLPTQVSFVSVSTTQGSCSQTAGTVTCNLNSISVGGLVLITINVSASTFSSSTLASNTATVSAITSDPNPTNNSSTTITTIAAPTAVQLASFRALTRRGGGILLEWKTREEIRNLGFNVYRMDAEGRHRLNPSIIAGSALWIRGGHPQHAAKTYQWFDSEGTQQAAYELEDVDLNGTRMPHGPVAVDVSTPPAESISQPLLLTELNRATVQPAPSRTRRISTPVPQIPKLASGEYRVSLEMLPAVKISVRSEGWYRITGAQLIAAGLDPNAEVRTLQLFAEGIEQPISILGHERGPLGPADCIEFYGTGIDTPFSDTRVYWLVSGSGPGKRIVPAPAAVSGTSHAQSFPFTVVREDRTTYLATLLNGENADNFFGAAVTSEAVDQELTVAHSDPNSSMRVALEVRLQGATDAQPHRVSVVFNSVFLGEVDFANLTNVTDTFSVDRELLHEGTNTVTLAALEGENDVSVVQSIALHYPHAYTADANWLKATASAGETVEITGFSSPQIRVFDITDPLAITQPRGTVRLEGANFGITLGLPDSDAHDRTLIAFSDDQVSEPSAVAFHKPSTLTRRRSGGQIVIIAHPDFEPSLEPLVKLRESRGHTVELMTIDQIFDAFNFGERSPFAVRDFLENAEAHWARKPHSVLLVGDASLDPRNYLGLGDFDFVPTRIIETAAFKTASDDWFSDFGGGFATIPTGRIPVRTAAEAALVVSKIVNYEKGIEAGMWDQQAVVIADQNVGADFSTAANSAVSNLPSFLNVTKILTDGLDANAARQQILSALNSGALLVDYSGHGSVEQWSFVDLLNDSSASALSNGNHLPVYLLMDCLNGFFHDVYSTSLAESLLLAPNGGAVAVWASSGFTDQPPQASMNQALLQILKTKPSIALGRAILDAKSGTTEQDVRRTWILFGDPAMHLQVPSSRSNDDH
jgi:uncharacterized repeat protein (TIGR01451 family)